MVISWLSINNCKWYFKTKIIINIFTMSCYDIFWDFFFFFIFIFFVWQKSIHDISLKLRLIFLNTNGRNIKVYIFFFAGNIKVYKLKTCTYTFNDQFHGWLQNISKWQLQSQIVLLQWGFCFCFCHFINTCRVIDFQTRYIRKWIEIYKVTKN